MAILTNKKRGCYFISYYLKLPDGKRKKISITNKEWKVTECKKKYLKAIELSEIEKDRFRRLGEFGIDRNGTFGSLVDRYIDDQRHTKKPQTAYAKEHAVGKHIIPCFNPFAPVETALAENAVISFRDGLWAKELTNEHKTRILRFMREIVDYAEEMEMVSGAFAKKTLRLLKAPNVSVFEPKRDYDVWTPQEYEAFRSTFVAKDWKFGVLFDVAYYGALRIGELLALNWNCVDFARKTIAIRESLDNRGNVGRPKTPSSSASVRLPEFVIGELRELKDGLMPEEDEAVFFADRTSRTTIRREMLNHTKMAKVKRIRFHDLRHSMASRLIAGGVNVVAVSKHLRHSSTQQTLDTYCHLFPGMMDEIMDGIGSRI